MNPVTPETNPLRAFAVSRRLSALNESVTLSTDAKAKALRAAGRPVVGFAAGEPDFETPAHVVEAAARALEDTSNFRYSPAAGLPELRDVIATQTSARSGRPVSTSQVVVTNGGKQAVYQAFQAVIDPGDEVLLPTPHWTTYPEVIRLADGVPVPVFAGAEHDYKVTPAQLERAYTPRTKALVFVSPSNPTGAVYTPEETRSIGEWALARGVWVITDEIYKDLVYDGVESVSVLALVPELAGQLITLDGVAKTYAMTGWRVGWMVAPDEVARAVANLQSHLTSNVSNISQRAAIAALTGPQDCVESFTAAFDRRRRALVSGLSAIDGVRVPMPQGAFYVYPEVTGLLGRDWSGLRPANTVELAELILAKTEVAVVPGEAFGPSGYLRLSFALADDALAEGIDRLRRFFS
ncbi:pyridoxal phosphate-dependent aminotransferase [Rhodococcus jostii]|uniref:Aminotransferase n=1 Tax=Rhodococcus jostii TaxID=132919 RepID=A0A1H4IJB2_RHOJO|nr:pyridoxal phosphate-dependent aminotransferase [Rhodococcus jostii]SEB34161.1 Aminotransferase class I and II [Rhodococcus jostii]